MHNGQNIIHRGHKTGTPIYTCFIWSQKQLLTSSFIYLFLRVHKSRFSLCPKPKVIFVFHAGGEIPINRNAENNFRKRNQLGVPKYQMPFIYTQMIKILNFLPHLPVHATSIGIYLLQCSRHLPSSYTIAIFLPQCITSHFNPAPYQFYDRFIRISDHTRPSILDIFLLGRVYCYESRKVSTIPALVSCQHLPIKIKKPTNGNQKTWPRKEMGSEQQVAVTSSCVLLVFHFID